MTTPENINHFERYSVKLKYKNLIETACGIGNTKKGVKSNLIDATKQTEIRTILREQKKSMKNEALPIKHEETQGTGAIQVDTKDLKGSESLPREPRKPKRSEALPL